MTDDTFRNDAGSPFANRSAPACDYCADGLPVVCRECGGGKVWLPHMDGTYARIGMPEHPFAPIHRIPDPEFDTVDIVPCGLA